jgi:hypothetical protein
MKRITHIALAMCVGLLSAGPLAMAQSPQANVYVGLGTVTDASNGQALDLFGTGTPINTPRLTGLYATVGGGFMFTDHFGAGAEINWRAGQGDYAGVNYRPIFYDFNGIWQPLKTKRFVPEIQAGVGGVAVHFNANAQSCIDPLVGCQTVNVGSESSNHFQTHFAVAARIYATPRIFFRPAVDVHWVNDFFQFGSNWVPEYTMGLGYSFGGEK